MELSSQTLNLLDQWLEGEVFTEKQHELILTLLKVEAQDAYAAGLANTSDYQQGLDDGHDQGFDAGYDAGKAEIETLRDEWFQQGWDAALLEYGFEE